MELWEAWLAVFLTSGFGSRRAARIRELVPDVRQCFDLPLAEVEDLLGPEKRYASKLRNTLKSQVYQTERELLAKHGVRVISVDDSDYPPLLAETVAPPPVLYVQGEFQEKDHRSVAIVGSRDCSAYGRYMAETLGRGLAELGVTVVSGLARGIDSYSQLGALQVETGRCVAVLGNGLLKYYPKENKPLQERISKRGVLVSQFPLRGTGSRQNFPMRNVTISGLSLGVVVVEAGAKSGALGTALAALDQGREVFAVPGRADSPLSVGTNRMLQEGAKLVMGVEDILDELGARLFDEKVREQAERSKILVASKASPKAKASPKKPPKSGKPAPAVTQPVPEPPPIQELSPPEQQVFNAATPEPLPVEELATAAGIAVHEALAALLTLEINGLVKRHPGNRYSRGRSS